MPRHARLDGSADAPREHVHPRRCQRREHRLEREHVEVGEGASEHRGVVEHAAVAGPIVARPAQREPHPACALTVLVEERRLDGEAVERADERAREEPDGEVECRGATVPPTSEARPEQRDPRGERADEEHIAPYGSTTDGRGAKRRRPVAHAPAKRIERAVHTVGGALPVRVVSDRRERQAPFHEEGARPCGRELDAHRLATEADHDDRHPVGAVIARERRARRPRACGGPFVDAGAAVAGVARFGRPRREEQDQRRVGEAGAQTV